MRTPLDRRHAHAGVQRSTADWRVEVCAGRGRAARQDQADLAVSADGSRVWVVLSYNSKPKDHRSGITRGAFVLDVAARPPRPAPRRASTCPGPLY